MGARQLILLLLAAMPAAAQYLIDPDEAGRVAPFFDKYTGRNSIGCELTLYRPRVGYTFRIQTAYNAQVPLYGYQGSEKLAVLTRVTPDDKEKQPFYLSQGLTIPPVPKDAPRKSVFGEITGAFHVGEGHYRVDLLLVDSNDRFCRKSWKINATRERHVQHMANAIPPGEVRPLVIRPWHRQIMNASCPAPIKMTVLLHAENFRRGSARVGSFGRSTLLSSVSSLIEQTPCANVKLIAFNLNQQREIFRQEGFTQYDLGKLSEAMDSLSLGTVDIRTLNNVGGGPELLYRLLDQERSARDPSDVVVMMSPILGNHGKKLKRELVGAREGNKPMFFYLDFRPIQLASWPNDWASEFVKALDGKVYHIFDPDSLAVAIQKVHKTTSDLTSDPAAN